MQIDDHDGGSTACIADFGVSCHQRQIIFPAMAKYEKFDLSKDVNDMGMLYMLLASRMQQSQLRSHLQNLALYCGNVRSSSDEAWRYVFDQLEDMQLLLMPADGMHTCTHARTHTCRAHMRKNSRIMHKTRMQVHNCTFIATLVYSQITTNLCNT